MQEKRERSHKTKAFYEIEQDSLFDGNDFDAIGWCVWGNTYRQNAADIIVK